MFNTPFEVIINPEAPLFIVPENFEKSPAAYPIIIKI